MKAFVVALSLVTTCTLASACAVDEWSMLRREVIIRNLLRDWPGGVEAAERLLNVTDSRFADDREKMLDSLTLLSNGYRTQQAYGKETFVRPSPDSDTRSSSVEKCTAPTTSLLRLLCWGLQTR